LSLFHKVHICMFKSIGNYSHIKSSLGYIKNSEANAINRDRSFFNDQCSKFRKKLKAELPTSTFFFSIDANGRCVNMSLYKMTIEAIIYL